MPDSVLTRDNLIGDSSNQKSFSLDLKAGETVVRGQVVGFLTASKKVVPFESGGAGGAELFYGIASQDVDATAGTLPVVTYVSGEFKLPGLIFDTTADFALVDDQNFINSARALGVILKKSQEA